ncbi:Potassium voltage-gated channel subfamily KQT member 5 [Portunus trituberculatus]|uniref:Potassium voltage-gated channel subfamily KQT member 5 n=1 Tax=Portunus trituberculatus TaxID=210409 RepID=A0A5B7DZP9_PORTR|nr:Potassium voltage-gated channel subfamily KQT member 5 [Portunus trituberculatus]
MISLDASFHTPAEAFIAAILTSVGFKHNASFVTRLPTIRRHRNAHSPSIKNRHTDSNHALDNLVNSNRINTSHSEDSVTKESSDVVLTKKNSDVHLRLAAAAFLTPMVLSETGTPTNGTPVEQDPAQFPVVLANLLHKEFGGNVATPRRPRSPSRDEDDDQPRVLQLTNQHKAAIRAIRKVSMVGRVVVVVVVMVMIKYFTARRKFKEALKPYDVKDVIEQYSAGHVDLLSRIRYFLARRKFKEALKPYDVKDVIEQYSSGHADLLTRVKYLHGRLDQILGKQGSKAKDVYESKISLASRIVKVERQVDDIESKLDQLIDLYMEDRKRLLALPPPVTGLLPTTPTSSAPLPGSPDSCSSGPTTSFTPITSSSTVIPSSSLTVSTQIQPLATSGITVLC